MNKNENKFDISHPAKVISLIKYQDNKGIPHKVTTFRRFIIYIYVSIYLTNRKFYG